MFDDCYTEHGIGASLHAVFANESSGRLEHMHASGHFMVFVLACIRCLRRSRWDRPAELMNEAPDQFPQNE